jgi:hypothetical protein
MKKDKETSPAAREIGELTTRIKELENILCAWLRADELLLENAQLGSEARITILGLLEASSEMMNKIEKREEPQDEQGER